jgi:hypothetical protein
MSVPDVIHCAAHPARVATGTCARCGAFRCEACGNNPFFKDHCGACVERVAGKASSRAMAAVIVGGLGLACYCPPVGIVALVLGNAELAAIDRGEASEAGRTYAQAGRIMGWIGLGLTVVGVGIGILMAGMALVAAQ